MYMTVIYEIMAKTMEMTHIGITVFRLNPIPNSRKLPSELYKKPGLDCWIAKKSIK
jgi:hypothetical protein